MKIQELFTEHELTDAYFRKYRNKYTFSKQNVAKLYGVVNNALAHYRAVSAFRFDLRFPKGYGLPLDMNDESRGYHDNKYMAAFIQSLSSRINAHIARRVRLGKRVHPCKVRYFWAREQRDSEVPHYHVMILLNRDAYRKLGRYNPNVNNLRYKIQHAWLSALNIDNQTTGGLVEFPKNGTYIIERQTKEAILPLLVRGIYFTKEQTKLKGFGFRCFGGSNT